MEDFVRKTKGVRDINSLPLNVNHELDLVSDVKGKIYIKILNRYKELLFDNGTEQWVIDMLNNLEVDVEQLKEDILDVEQALSELPIIEGKLGVVETKLSQINTLFAQLQTDVNGLDLRTAELEREVVQLALKDQELLDKINNLDVDVDLDVLYTNSIDFGDYDYSGNPNLSAKLNASSFSSGTGATVADDGDEIVFTLDGTNQLGKYKTETQVPLIEGKQYTISCEIMLETGFTGDPSGICLQHAFLPGGSLVLQTETVPKNELNTWQKLIGTKTIEYGSKSPSSWYSIFRDIRNLKPTGKVRLRNIKIEEGSTVTPYQPNLLIAPYWLSKESLNENIPYHKYVSINIESSKNPNDYHWIPLAKAAETVDARLTKTITTNDTVNALQNSRLTALESKVVDTAWTNITPISPFTATKQIQVKRQNGIVYMRGGLSDGTGDCFTLPEGFRPPNDGYEYHYLLPGQSTAQTDTAKIYVRPSGLCSIISKTGTVPTLLEPIMFSVT